MQLLLSIIMIACLMGCVSTNVKHRDIPKALNLQENAKTNEFEVCDPSTGAWQCERFSKKTPIEQASHDETLIHRQCIESQYELGPIAGHLLGHVEFKDQGQYFLTRRQLKLLSDLAPSLQHQQIIILGFSDDSGPIDANTVVAQKRAQHLAQALQKFGVSKEMISFEGQASRCLQPGLNNKRALIFKA